METIIVSMAVKLPFSAMLSFKGWWAGKDGGGRRPGWVPEVPAPRT